jgi:xylulokinase
LILTLDLGTSTTKAVVWDSNGPRAVGRAGTPTVYTAGGRAEQDPTAWWGSVVAACGEARTGSPGSYAAVSAVGFSAARQTVVGVDAGGHPLGPALVWSDRRAFAEAGVMAEGLGGVEKVKARTGGVLDGSAVAAKAVWLAAHEPERWAASRWLLTPRDLVVWRMTGEVATDSTMVSAAGLVDGTGTPVPELVSGIGDRLPPVVGPDRVVGLLSADPAGQLGLEAGLPVVIGAGDRACEVLGAGGSPDRPMVSWGTTANVSVPVGVFPRPVPDGLVVTGAATGGWLLEGGLSAAGSLLSWLSTLTGVGTDVLMTRAGAAPVGAHGVVALPWFGGARAPWWREGARGGFVGLSFDHDAGDLARAAVESVAFEVRRCLAAAGAAGSARSLALAGTPGVGATGTGTAGNGDRPSAPWPQILTAVTGLPAVRRRSGQAASAGAALLTAIAVGEDYDLDELDPVVETVEPDETDVARYAELRDRVDAVADAVVALETTDHHQWKERSR